MMELQKFEVGDIVCNPSKDESKFDLTSGGALLVLKFSNPTAAEKRDIKSGAAQFKLAVQDGILFFLARFGVSNWIDAPYHSSLSQYTLFRPREGYGLLLHIMLIDAATGRLQVQRAIGLSTQFSSALLDIVSQQSPIKDVPSYLQAVQRVYARYSTDYLVAAAIAEN